MTSCNNGQNNENAVMPTSASLQLCMKKVVFHSASLIQDVGAGIVHNAVTIFNHANQNPCRTFPLTGCSNQDAMSPPIPTITLCLAPKFVQRPCLSQSRSQLYSPDD